MRILFNGSVAYSDHAWRKPIVSRAEIVGVCALEESVFNAHYLWLTLIANDAGKATFYAQNIDNSKSFEWIQERKLDVIFTSGGCD